MKNKVYFFSKINNFLLKCMPYIFPTIIGVTILLKYRLIKERFIEIIGYDFNDFEVGIILIIFESLITLSFKMLFKYIEKLKNISSFFKHKLYSWLRPMLNKIKHKTFRILGNKSINSFYYINYIPTPKQKQIKEYISSILSSKESTNKVIWIQGDTFSGKTTTVSNILIDMISEKAYYNSFKMFDNRIIYIDFTENSFIDFITEYENKKFKNSVLIIDNTYILSENNLLRLITCVTSDVSAKLIIICMREFYETTNDPYLIEELNKRINLVGKHFCVNKNDGINRIKKYYILSSNYYIKSLEKLDSCTQFHYVNICEKDKENNKKIVKDIIDYLKSDIINTNFIQEIIFMVACFCIFTGNFTKSQLDSCLSNRKEKLLLDIVLSELHSCGFIDRSPYRFGEIYILNAQVAKDYFKIGFISKQFKNVMYNIFEQEFNCNKESNPYLAFLYGCMLKSNFEQQSKLFNSLAININFKILLDEMNYLCSINNDLSTFYQRELGILYDRTGDFKKARYAFKSLLINAQNQNNDESAIDSFYRLVQIDHSEYLKHKDLELKCHKINSPYLELQKEYWKLHIDMHKGKFSFYGFLELLDKTQLICCNASYDYLHLARRIYFDTYRTYYLTGPNKANELFEIEKRGKKVQEYLQKNLDEFNLYYEKFTFLFLLEKEILFNLIFDDNVVENEVYKQFIKKEGIAYTDMSNKDRLLEICINNCEKLEKEFEKTGDKTFNFIRYYRTELLIIKNDSSCKALIRQYRDFGTEDKEYRLYAEFLELKYQISKFLNINEISIDSEKEREKLRLAINKQFKIILNFFNGSYINDYAKMRYDIYKILMDILDDKSNLSIKQLKEALKFAKKNNYNREFRILNKIKESKGDISFGWGRNIILYYPIVPQ